MKKNEEQELIEELVLLTIDDREELESLMKKIQNWDQLEKNNRVIKR